MINIRHLIIFYLNFNLQRRYFIKFCHLFFAVLIYGPVNMQIIEPERITLDSSEIVLVLRNNPILKELPSESIAVCLLERQVDEVAPLPIDHVMVADNL